MSKFIEQFLKLSNEKSIEDAMKFCYDRHDVYCNQKYGSEDELPYSFHLRMVVAVAKRFIHLIPKELQPRVLIACAGHDLIEDARLTYNDVVVLFGKFVADIVYACSDEKGHTRGERHSNKFYEELRENEFGVFVKLCDVIANGSYSRIMGSRMFENYQNDLPHMMELLYVENEYEEMWKELELILS